MTQAPGTLQIAGHRPVAAPQCPSPVHSWSPGSAPASGSRCPGQRGMETRITPRQRRGALGSCSPRVCIVLPSPWPARGQVHGVRSPATEGFRPRTDSPQLVQWSALGGPPWHRAGLVLGTGNQEMKKTRVVRPQEAYSPAGSIWIQDRLFATHCNPFINGPRYVIRK